MRRILTLIITAVLLFSLCIPAAAHDVPREDTLGSIEMTVRYDGKPVSGGKLTCTQVGEVWEEDGNYSFRRVSDGEALEDIQDAALAQQLADFAKENRLTGTTLTVGETGTVTFQNLKIGLYLITQDTPAQGYSALKPFLVSVPYMVDGKYEYDVTAQVKSELERVPETTKATTPTGPKLPQTGQLNWPVPVLVVLGLLLFSAGWVMRFGKKKDGYEK